MKVRPTISCKNCDQFGTNLLRISRMTPPRCSYRTRRPKYSQDEYLLSSPTRWHYPGLLPENSSSPRSDERKQKIIMNKKNSDPSYIPKKPKNEDKTRAVKLTRSKSNQPSLQKKKVRRKNISLCTSPKFSLLRNRTRKCNDKLASSHDLSTFGNSLS